MAQTSPCCKVPRRGGLVGAPFAGRLFSERLRRPRAQKRNFFACFAGVDRWPSAFGRPYSARRLGDISCPRAGVSARGKGYSHTGVGIPQRSHIAVQPCVHTAIWPQHSSANAVSQSRRSPVPKPKIPSQRSHAKDPKPNSQSQRSQAEDPKPKIRSQRSQANDPKPKIPSQRFKAKHPTLS